MAYDTSGQILDAGSLQILVELLYFTGLSVLGDIGEVVGEVDWRLQGHGDGRVYTTDLYIPGGWMKKRGIVWRSGWLEALIYGGVRDKDNMW